MKKGKIYLLAGIICIIVSIICMVVSQTSTGYYRILAAAGGWLMGSGIIEIRQNR